MEKEKIDRINELARKKKTEGLTADEKAEQEALRKEYLAGYRANLEAILKDVIIQEPDGTRHALVRKAEDDMPEK
ncbi:MAG: DUF896 domain-containing protein [Clostridiales bacterium]|nr:DUF896 domain-containing protein [Clostridiales bacterium]